MLYGLRESTEQGWTRQRKEEISQEKLEELPERGGQKKDTLELPKKEEKIGRYKQIYLQITPHKIFSYKKLIIKIQAAGSAETRELQCNHLWSHSNQTAFTHAK